ncbi:uncharacterized protein [Primulina huaijiensis]|uniref:uncharacterized protein n=1 Tax=Primulina huaijiensis TaxID=1492673 RepID=UPI003CC73181
MLTATFFFNRIPSPVLGLNSPFGLLYGSPADYSHFRTFGCLAFVSTLPCHRLKFHPRARTCVFLGYQPGIKGYKVYDLENKQIFFSRDVVFHEDIFPFHSISCSDPIIDPFPDLVLPQPPLTSVSDSSTSTSLPLVSPSSDTLLPRCSSRHSRPPSYLHDYHCNLLTNVPLIPSKSTLYPVSQSISYDNLSLRYRTFALNISAHVEPTFYHQAVKVPEWRAAMQSEIEAL